MELRRARTVWPRRFCENSKTCKPSATFPTMPCWSRTGRAAGVKVRPCCLFTMSTRQGADARHRTMGRSRPGRGTGRPAVGTPRRIRPRGRSLNGTFRSLRRQAASPATLAYDAAALAAVSRSDGGLHRRHHAAAGFVGSDGIFRFLSHGVAQRGLAVLSVGRRNPASFPKLPRPSGSTNFRKKLLN